VLGGRASPLVHYSSEPKGNGNDLIPVRRSATWLTKLFRYLSQILDSV
jgi:hypothetical protein